jgi:hypothetical protein
MKSSRTLYWLLSHMSHTTWHDTWTLTFHLHDVGSQALKALKEAGVASVLINPNIATIQTNHFIADEIYYRKCLPRTHRAPFTHSA